MAEYLGLSALRKSFGNFQALQDIQLSIEKGEFVSFLGPSGCGKTTLLRIIAGLETRTAGSIVQSGRDISRLPPAERDYGIVFQSYALFPSLNVTDNVAYGLVNRKVARRAIAERVEELLKLVGLPGSGPKFPAQLSGGQSSASHPHGRWPRSRGCCCSTSRCRRSTRWSAFVCAAKFAACKSRLASRPSWSRTIRKKPCRWPTALWS